MSYISSLAGALLFGHAYRKVSQNADFVDFVDNIKDWCDTVNLQDSPNKGEFHLPKHAKVFANAIQLVLDDIANIIIQDNDLNKLVNPKENREVPHEMRVQLCITSMFTLLLGVATEIASNAGLAIPKPWIQKAAIIMAQQIMKLIDITRITTTKELYLQMVYCLSHELSLKCHTYFTKCLDSNVRSENNMVQLGLEFCKQFNNIFDYQTTIKNDVVTSKRKHDDSSDNDPPKKPKV